MLKFGQAPEHLINSHMDSFGMSKHMRAFQRSTAGKRSTSSRWWCPVRRSSGSPRHATAAVQECKEAVQAASDAAQGRWARLLGSRSAL